jgi:plasmid stability protein
MRELAVGGQKRVDVLRHGKRAKAEMRSAFRSVLAVVEQSQVRLLALNFTNNCNAAPKHLCLLLLLSLGELCNLFLVRITSGF